MTAAEKASVELVKSGNMTEKKAKGILEVMDPRTPWDNRLDYLKVLAAVVVMYPHNMDVAADGNTTIRDLFVAACDPRRWEWYMNGARFRSARDATS